MNHFVVIAVFLASVFSGAFAASKFSEEIIYKLPGEYITMSRPREMQSVRKVYNGKRAKNGKTLYIFGGSSSFYGLHETRLTELLTQRLGQPVQVHLVGTNSQHITDSYGFIPYLPKGKEAGDSYALMTWGGYRTGVSASGSLVGSYRGITIMANDRAVTNLIENEGLFEKEFMPKNLGTGEEFLTDMDNKYRTSLVSLWIKYTIYDKFRKLADRRNKRKLASLFKDEPVFQPIPDSELARITKSFKQESVVKRRQAGHKKYIDRLTNRYEKMTEQQAEDSMAFQLFFMEQSKIEAEKRGYKFGTFQLPLTAVLYTPGTKMSNFRKEYVKRLDALSEKVGFDNFYLEDHVKILDKFEYWQDAGHLNKVGQRLYEPFVVDALEAFLTEGADGVYAR